MLAEQRPAGEGDPEAVERDGGQQMFERVSAQRAARGRENVFVQLLRDDGAAIGDRGGEQIPALAAAVVSLQNELRVHAPSLLRPRRKGSTGGEHARPVGHAQRGFGRTPRNIPHAGRDRRTDWPTRREKLESFAANFNLPVKLKGLKSSTSRSRER